jgi:uncharacterized surface protein with fasciclin (FAS1) repeats
MTGLKKSRGALIACMVLGASLVGHGASAQNMNCIDTLAGIGDASRFVDFATRGRVASELREVGPFTIFVPTNDAVATVSPYLRTFLFPGSDGHQADSALVRALFHAHVLEGRYTSAAVEPGMTVKSQTLAGTPIEFMNADGVITIMVADSQPARVVRSNVLCSNGIIHFIDRVLVR